MRHQGIIAISILTLAVLVTVLFRILPNNNTAVVLPERIDFNQHIRPILAQNCYLCHGPDSSSRQAELRLDEKEFATEKLPSGARAIIPGSPNRSALIKRIQSKDADFKMPPPEMKKNLSKTEIAMLERWIDEGAEWKKHWSLIPPEATAARLQEPVHEITDQLIIQELEQRTLQPNSRAEFDELIRRVSYVLTGLPPSIEEIESFSADRSTAGFDKIVDHYLASPHFGEHWARHWMDLVRYAEHMGHEFDFEIANAWKYRDYLIRAFNSDIPYNQLIKEHLAGDLLPTPRISSNGENESRIGTTYALLGEGKHSPVNVKQEEADRIDNMIDVTSKTFLGLTVSCARCHDHKFDPIPTTDYHAMYGMFESSRLGPVSIRNQAEIDPIITELQSVNLQIRQSERELVMKKIDQLSTDESNRLSDYLANTLEVGSVIDHSEKAFTTIGDFRNNSFDGWYADGLAFGEEPVNGLASSRRHCSGTIGALRSPNFEIRDSFIVAFARGSRGMIRVIADNFQQIRYPLYQELEKAVDHQEIGKVVMDVSIILGHKAYIEILPGRYQKHVYEICPDDYIEVSHMVSTDRPNSISWKGTSDRYDFAGENQIHQYLENNDVWVEEQVRAFLDNTNFPLPPKTNTTLYRSEKQIEARII